MKTLCHFEMFYQNYLSFQQNVWNAHFGFTDVKRFQRHLLLVARDEPLLNVFLNSIYLKELTSFCVPDSEFCNTL